MYKILFSASTSDTRVTSSEYDDLGDAQGICNLNITNMITYVDI
jgi:hypothetical protein